MPITAKPEILRPRAKPAGRLPGFEFTDSNLDLLAHLLDDFIRIPGTPIRFGLDGIVGFIPGIGDLLGGLASTILIVAAWSRGVPNVVIVRMVLNVAIETPAAPSPSLATSSTSPGAPTAVTTPCSPAPLPARKSIQPAVGSLSPASAWCSPRSCLYRFYSVPGSWSISLPPSKPIQTQHQYAKLNRVGA